MGYVTHFSNNPPPLPISIDTDRSPTDSNIYPFAQAFYLPSPSLTEGLLYNCTQSTPPGHSHQGQSQSLPRRKADAMEPGVERKTHSSCDPCRSRKLKCSGERTGCERCRREGLSCVYSPQKQMGRPRKRQRSLDDAAQTSATQLADTNTSTSFSGLSTPPLADNEYAASNSSSYLNDSESWPTPKSYGMRTSVGSQQQAYQTTFSDFHWPANVSHTEPMNLPDPSVPTNFNTYHDPAFTYTSGPSSPPQLASAAYTPALSAETLDAEDEPACPCLANMYLAAAEMQNSRARGFPFALQPMRAALNTTYNMLVCPMCPLHMASARQSIMLVSTLLMSIIGELDKLLRNIDKEALRAQQQGRRKIFRMGDNAHRGFHTGTPDCPAAFEVELDPREWRVLAKRAVAKLVYAGRRSNSNTPNASGTSDTQDNTQLPGAPMALDSLISSFEERQASWHRNPPVGLHEMHQNNPNIHAQLDEPFTCIKLAREARRQVEMLNLN